MQAPAAPVRVHSNNVIHTPPRRENSLFSQGLSNYANFDEYAEMTVRKVRREE